MARKKSAAPVIDIGISAKDRAKIAEGLSRLLADTFTLYLKTHNFHWNVRGPMFQTLHLMFEQQYNELWLALDAIAERIRALGMDAPGTLFRVREALVDPGDRRGARGAGDGSAAGRGAGGRRRAPRARLFPAVEKAGDEPTADLLTQRMQVHEKTAWMLRSLLEQ